MSLNIKKTRLFYLNYTQTLNSKLKYHDLNITHMGIHWVRSLQTGFIFLLILLSMTSISSSDSRTISDIRLNESENRITAFEDMMVQVNGTVLPDSEKQDLIDAFIEEQKPFGFPITGGDNVYFIYQSATSSIVHLGGSGHYTGIPEMKHVTGTDLWYLFRNYASDSRLFYGFRPDNGDWISDPLNNLTRTFLLNGEVESELRMPNYYDDGSTSFTDDVGSQIINQSFTSDVMDGWTRNIKIYLPPGYNDSGSTRYSTAYVIDSRYLSEAFAENILNYMIVNEFIEPMIVVFANVIGEHEVGFTLDLLDWWGQELAEDDCTIEIDPTNNPGKKNLCISKSAESIATELVPYIDSTYPTLNDSTKRAHIGFSSAADFTSYIVAQYPEVFKLGGIHDGCCADNFFDLLKTGSPTGFRFYLLNSFYWGPIHPTERSEEAIIMENKGFSGLYRVLNQGHDWGLIQRSFGETLKFLFSDDQSDFVGSPGLGEPTAYVTPTIQDTSTSDTSSKSDEESSPFFMSIGISGILILAITSRWILNRKQKLVYCIR